MAGPPAGPWATRWPSRPRGRSSTRWSRTCRAPSRSCRRCSSPSYAGLFEQVWGPGSLDCVKDVAGTYERIARSIAAYERSAEVNPFSSKYDSYLKGQAELTEQEAWGLELFEGKAHVLGLPHQRARADGEPPLFTDFTYDNLGVPKNPETRSTRMPRKWNPDGWTGSIPAWAAS